MEIEEPSKTFFTVYSKSGCPNCTKVKALLKEQNLLFNVINCDDYIIEDKDYFLAFIKERVNKECNTFPMVFNHGIFIGGYTETQQYINRLFLYFDENQF
jgi:glutaredoxin